MNNLTVCPPENYTKKYESLFIEISNGQIKIPKFQREFVWEKEQSAKLIDSIIRGFPIGTFIFWKTKEPLRSFKNIGNKDLKEIPKGDYVYYILDGQQRITSLYAVRSGSIVTTKEKNEVDYRDIYIDLSVDIDSGDPIVVTEKEKNTTDDQRYISVNKLLNSTMSELLVYMDNLDKIENYKAKLSGYDFSVINISDYPIEVACEIFSRINTGGKKLTLFEIMVAKTFDEQSNFDLAVKFEELKNGGGDYKNSLSDVKFDSLPESLVMQCISAVLKRAIKGADILKINRENFILSWDPMVDSFFSAIDFVRSELGIPVSLALPYPAILIPITYFFYRNKNKKPTGNQKKYLEQFFYWCGIEERYSSASDSKVTDDFNKMDAILDKKSPDYSGYDLNVSPKRIADTYFSSGNAFCKTILCLLISSKPKSFDTGGEVLLDNSHLKISTSKNYHHFFPKKYLSLKHKTAEPNLIANITLIDGYSNKHKIGKKSPSEYIAEFSKENKDILSILKGHFINDIESFGIVDNNYKIFISKRSEEIAKGLNAKLNP